VQNDQLCRTHRHKFARSDVQDLDAGITGHADQWVSILSLRPYYTVVGNRLLMRLNAISCRSSKERTHVAYLVVRDTICSGVFFVLEPPQDLDRVVFVQYAPAYDSLSQSVNAVLDTTCHIRMALHTQRKPGRRREACTGRTPHHRTGLSRSVLHKTMLDMHPNSLESSLDLVWLCRAVSTRETLLRTLTYPKSRRTPQSRQFPVVVHAWRAEDGIARYRSNRNM
jgi:hypothetical protein